MSNARLFLRKLPDGSEVEISADTPVGREEVAGLCLKDKEASRSHARLSVTDGNLFVLDLKSRNGTFVNGERLPAGERRKLVAGDRVRFFHEEFIFRQERAASDETLPSITQQEPVRPGDSARPPAWVIGRNEDGTQRVTDDDRRLAIELAKSKLNIPTAPEGENVPHLSVVEGGRPRRTVALRPAQQGRSEWIVGRSGDCDIVFDVPGVSAVHAKLVCDQGRWEISDQLSSNGTWVNGAEIRRLYLSSGDFVCFGPVECVFRLPGARAASRTGSAPATVKPRLSPLTIAVISFVVAAAVFLGVMMLLP